MNEQGALPEDEHKRVYEVFNYRDTVGLDQVRWSVFNLEAAYLEVEIQRQLLSAFKRLGVTALNAADFSVLEVGCGRGKWMRWLLECGFRNISGTDLFLPHLQDGKRLSASFMRFSCSDAAALPFPDSSFDFVLQLKTFCCIMDPQVRRRGAQELLRVVKPGGAVIWLDLRKELWHRLCRSEKEPYLYHFTRRDIHEMFPGSKKSWKRFGLNPFMMGAFASIANKGLLRSILHRTPILRRFISWPQIPMVRFPYIEAEMLNYLGLGAIYDLVVIRKPAA